MFAGGVVIYTAELVNAGGLFKGFLTLERLVFQKGINIVRLGVPGSADCIAMSKSK